MVSCNSKRIRPVIDSFVDQQECILKEFKEYPFDSIGQPDFILSVGDFIVLSEPKFKSLISVFNLKTNRMYKTLPKGIGPDEMPDIMQMGMLNNDEFFVRSTHSKEFFIYSSVDSFSSVHKKHIVPPNSGTSYWSENLILSTNTGEKRYSAYDMTKNIQSEFGEDLPFNDFSQTTVSQLLFGMSIGSDELKRYAWFSMYGEAFEIYNYSNPLEIKLVKQTVGILPIIVSESMAFSLDSKLGFPSITTNDSYIFALYSENTLKDAIEKRDEIFYCNVILIYDWDGNPVKKLLLDKPVRSISFNKKHNMIYCVGLDNDFNIGLFYIDKW